MARMASTASPLDEILAGLEEEERLSADEDIDEIRSLQDELQAVLGETAAAIDAEPLDVSVIPPGASVKEALKTLQADKELRKRQAMADITSEYVDAINETRAIQQERARERAAQRQRMLSMRQTGISDLLDKTDAQGNLVVPKDMGLRTQLIQVPGDVPTYVQTYKPLTEEQEQQVRLKELADFLKIDEETIARQLAHEAGLKAASARKVEKQAISDAKSKLELIDSLAEDPMNLDIGLVDPNSTIAKAARQKNMLKQWEIDEKKNKKAAYELRKIYNPIYKKFIDEGYEPSQAHQLAVDETKNTLSRNRDMLRQFGIKLPGQKDKPVEPGEAEDFGIGKTAVSTALDALAQSANLAGSQMPGSPMLEFGRRQLSEPTSALWRSQPLSLFTALTTLFGASAPDILRRIGDVGDQTLFSLFSDVGPDAARRLSETNDPELLRLLEKLTRR